MAEKDDKTPPAQPDKLTVGDLKKWMKDEVTSLAEAIAGKSGDKKEPAKDDKAQSIADEVRAELAKLEAKSKREAKEKSIDDQLAELTQMVQPKPPTERNHPRLHKIMGWGDNE